MDILFIFVNFLRGTTRHNLRLTKQFTSAGYTAALQNSASRAKYISGAMTYAPFAPANPDCLFISPFAMSVMNDYRIEYDAERIRLMKFPLLPSRLSATYAFGDFATCELVSKKYGWPLDTVRKFRLERDELTRVHKCNMEIISLMRHAYMVSSSSGRGDELVWESYWSGHGNLQMELPDIDFKRKTYDSGEIWEYLIEGRLLLEEGQAST